MKLNRSRMVMIFMVSSYVTVFLAHLMYLASLLLAEASAAASVSAAPTQKLR